MITIAKIDNLRNQLVALKTAQEITPDIAALFTQLEQAISANPNKIRMTNTAMGAPNLNDSDNEISDLENFANRANGRDHRVERIAMETVKNALGEHIEVQPKELPTLNTKIRPPGAVHYNKFYRLQNDKGIDSFYIDSNNTVHCYQVKLGKSELCKGRVEDKKNVHYIVTNLKSESKKLTAYLNDNFDATFTATLYLLTTRPLARTALRYLRDNSVVLLNKEFVCENLPKRLKNHPKLPEYLQADVE